MKNYMSGKNLVTHIRRGLRVSVSQTFFETYHVDLDHKGPTLQLSPLIRVWQTSSKSGNSS